MWYNIIMNQKYVNFYTNVAKYGNTILYRGYDGDGKPDLRRIKYKPTLYVPSNNKGGIKSQWKGLDGTQVEPMKFPNMKEASLFVQSYSDMNDYKIYGNTRFPYAFIQELFPDSIRADTSLINTVYIDIEVYSDDGFPEAEDADKEVVCIGLYSSKTEEYTVFGLKDFDPKICRVDEGKKINYIKLPHETALLETFLAWWEEEYNTPDIITGWNVRFFDIPYLVHRITRVMGEKEAKRLSPWKLINSKSINKMGKLRSVYDLVGIQTLDYLELFQKFAVLTYGNQESYSLDHIAYVVLGESKLDYSEAGTLSQLYNTDHQKYISYNIKDVQLVKRLDEKLGFLNIVLTMSYMAGVNYTDTLGTTTIWDTIIFRELARRKIAIPADVKPPPRINFPGAYVKPTINGLHKWVVSFDLNSLYPNLIRQYNMSPETLVPQSFIPGIDENYIIENQHTKISNDNLAVAPNGAVFRRDIKGILPELVEQIYNKRVQIKKHQLEAEQQLDDINTEIERRILT